jgi:Sortilin, neurotensin receptor 3,
VFESPGSVGAMAAGVRPCCRSTRWFAVLAALVSLVVAPAGAQTQVADSSTTRGFGADDIVGIGWRGVGPANMGGRVAAIAVVPGSRTSFYVSYGTGGVFKTDNLGVSFTPVFDKTGVQSIGAIEVADAPADWRGWTDEERKSAAPAGGKKGKAKNLPESKNDLATRGKGKIVWVGTGEGNNRNSSSWGHGVYRSTDAGGSFQFVGLAETHDIPRLAVDPRDPDVCYVAAAGHLWGWNPERGIFKTRDGGKTWDHVLAIDDKTGACDVVIDPKQPNTVYAAMYARRRTPWSYTGTSEEGGIYRSDDAGRSWKKLTQGLPPRTGRIGLALFPKDPRILYAVVESDWGGSGRDPFENRSPSGGLFRSEDRGDTWTRINEASFRPFYFSRVAIDPENDQRIYIPGWDVGISDDGGRTIRRSSDNVHVDHHAIVVNPADPNEILIGCDGGLYLSYDRAATWEYRNNVAVGQYYRVAVDDSDPYRIGGGLQDNGSWIGPSATLFETMDSSKDGILNSDWRMIFFGDGFGVAFDPTDPNRVYATSQGGYLARIQLDTNVMKMIRPSPKEGEERVRFNWNAPFIVSQHDPTVLYQGGNKLFRLEARGDRWFAMGGDLTRNEPDKTATVGSDAETFGTIVTIAESPV